MRRVSLGLLLLLGLTIWLPVHAQEETLEEDTYQPTVRYTKFLQQMQEAGETFEPREYSSFKDHRTRVAYAQEGFRVFRAQLQHMYLVTRYEHFEAGLPVVAEMEELFDNLVCLAASTLKPLSQQRFMNHVRPLYCWLAYLRRALECGDRYFLNYAFEHLSKYNRELRHFYGYRQCWEMTYWKRHYEECS